MSAHFRIFVFSNALVKVPGCIPNIICISTFLGDPTLVPWVFLDPRESREAVKTSGEAARRKKPLVTLDLNLTSIQTPGSGSDPRARIG